MALNPMLVKEVYQSFRGWGLIIGFAVALLVPLLGFLEMVSETSAQGDYYARIVVLALAFAGIIILPLGAGAALRQDIISGTIELIALSRLSPYKMIMGRFQSSMMRLLLLFAAVMPFTVSSLFLGDITPEQVVTLLVTVFCCSFAAIALNLMWGAMASMDPRYAIPSLVLQLLSMLVPLLLLFLGMIFVFDGMQRFHASYFLGIGFVSAVALTCLFLALAMDMASPIAIRRFSRSKVVFMFFVVCLTGVYWVVREWRPTSFYLSYSDIDGLFGWIIFIMALFVPAWAGVDRARPNERWRHARLNYIFGDGLLNTLRYTVLLCLVMMMPFFFVESSEKAMLAFLFVSSRFVLFIGFAALLRAWINPKSLRGMVLWLLLLMVLVLANIVVSFGGDSLYLNTSNPVGRVFQPAAFFIWSDEPRYALRHVSVFILPFIFGVGLALWAQAIENRRGR